MLYTGVTRGTRLVALVGQKKAIATAVRNAAGRHWWSTLGEWLRDSAAKPSPNKPC
jgi:exodeoxyribonuclease V alpha subunit